MPSLAARVRQWKGPKPTPFQRLERWIRKRATPPDHIQKRPLRMLMAVKVQKTNGFDTAEVWLTPCGELRLGNPIDGLLVGRIPS